MKIKLLIALIVLSIGLSCGPTPRPLDPDTVARDSMDFIEAIASDNCDKASSYWLSENRREFYNACREERCKIVETGFDAVKPEFDPMGLEQNQAGVVTVHGHFLHRCEDTGEEFVTNLVHIWFMRRGNTLFVSGFEEG